MPKRTKDEERQRLLNNGHALRSEQLRAIEENSELQADLSELRQSYNMDCKDAVDQLRWRISLTKEEAASFLRDVNHLKEKYGINKRLEEKFWDELWNIPYRHEFYPKQMLGGMPTRFLSSELGSVLLITPETDISNELVIEYIKKWQANEIKQYDCPPQPREIKDSPKLDWQPVWEWGLRHPQITRKAIAEMLHRSYTEVKRKLEELDKQFEPPPLYIQK